VQNLPDGRVKVVAEGEEPVLERFLHDLRINDPLIDVQDIEVDYTGAMGDFLRFEKMVGTGETDQRLDKAAELLSELIVVNKQIAGQLIVNNEVLKDVREEVKGSREDINRVYESTQDIAQKITSSGELIAEKIDDAREEIISEVKELRSDLKDDLKERLTRMEADVSQIKARIGL